MRNRCDDRAPKLRREAALHDPAAFFVRTPRRAVAHAPLPVQPARHAERTATTVIRARAPQHWLPDPSTRVPPGLRVLAFLLRSLRVLHDHPCHFVRGVPG